MQLIGSVLPMASTDITISKIDEVHIRVQCDKGIAMELSEYFTFFVPNYKFHPSFRNKTWDGRIRLFNRSNHTIYSGLAPYVESFCKEREYTCENDSSVDADEEFSDDEAMTFIDTLGIPFMPRDYQMKAFVYAIRKRRGLLLSPTASGKSLIIYLIARYLNCKTLIIVPTISLVSQLSKDFEDYGWDSNENVHKIVAGATKTTNKQVIISTWQSIYKQPKEWFSQFDIVIGDEAHLFKAQSLTSILSKMTNCAYRYGLTGTLDGTQTHKLVLEGLFGRVKQITTTKELIDAGSLAKFRIKALVLKHDAAICAENKNNKYQEEIDYLVSSVARNKFIRNLAVSLKGNTLVLYQLVEKHGKVLHKMIDESIEDRRLFFVHGGVDGEEREEVRRITEEIVDNVVLNFGDTRISCKENELVLLTDGTTKKAKYITENDDIDDCWILNKNIRQQEST
jgi:hypothetical protein